MLKLADIQDALGSPQLTESLLEKAKSFALEYRNSLGSREVYPTQEAIKALDQFNEPLPKEPEDPTTLLQSLHVVGSPATVAQSGGRYFGFVNGSILPPALAVKWLANTWDQNAALYLMSPVAATLENICEKWLVELFGLPQETAAGFVSGTSTATLCGLAAARNVLLANLGWNIHEHGMCGAPELKIVMSKHAHASVFTALSILGFGRNQVIHVKSDEQGCLLPEALPELDNRTLLLLQAGNVNSGGFESFRPICSAAKKAGAWVHIDGAFGLWAACSKQTRHLTDGMELADSWSVDAHKTLNAPYDNGIILCHNRDALTRAIQTSGSYIAYSDQRDGMSYTPEMSRRARAIELWATLKSLGSDGVDALVSGLCDHAQNFAEKLKAHNLRILNRIDFNQVLVACDRPEQTTATLHHLQQSGVCWCGGSTWRGEPVIRISVCSWSTTQEDIHLSVDAFIAAREKARGL